MTHKQYLEICKITDEILQSQNSSSTRVAIPWLHVVRAHHVFLQEYEVIYDNNYNSFFYLSKRKLYYLLLLLTTLFESLFFNNSNWIKNLKKISNIDVIYLSHLLNSSQLLEKDDFYFSNLPQKTSKAGFKSILVLINHNSRNINQDNQNTINRLILPSTLGFINELKNIFLLWSEHKVLKKEMRLESNKIKRKALYLASIEVLSHKTLSSLRIGKQIEDIVDRFGAKALVTTHEGYAWERKVFDSARLANKNINCIAYTHAPIFKKQHAVKRNLASQYNPDYILNSGNTQKKQFEKYGLLKNIEMNVLGSVRSIKEESKNQKHKSKTKQSLNNQFCLVVPEGNKQEINILFDFSLACAIEMPHFNFIWRLHPLFSFDKLNREKYKNLPKNIILSNQVLKNDLLRAEWVLFRASSVVIQAVVSGLKPIYLHRINEIKIDPIHEIKNWKSEIQTVNDFKLTVTKELGNYTDYDHAKKYCMDLYTPLDEKIIIDTIRKKICNE